MPRAKPLKPGIPESAVLAQTLEALKTFGIEPERQNTGMAMGASGKPVRFGTPGNSDIRTIIPRGKHAGKVLLIETKRGGFDPRRLTRTKEKAHWERQLAKLRKANEDGGIAFWVNDSTQVMRVMPKILMGCWVEIDGQGFPWVTDGNHGEDDADEQS